jgi:cell division transport system permease protein
MPIRFILYFLKKALEHLRVNPFLTLVTLSTITISLVILGLFGLVYLSVQQVLQRWGDEFRVTVYLNDTVGQNEADSMRSELGRWPEVQEVTYTSKAQAMAWFRTQLQEYAGILEGLRENPLPASLEIKLRADGAGSGTVDQLVSRLRQRPGVADIHYGQTWLARLKVFMEVVKLVGIAVGGLLLLATVVVVSNTVKLTFYARQEELEIMRLVGATDFFIKAPFLIEGLLHGVSGGALAAGTLVLLSHLFLSHLHIPLRLALAPDAIVSPPLIGSFLGLGVALGLVGSSISLRRFLRP